MTKQKTNKTNCLRSTNLRQFAIKCNSFTLLLILFLYLPNTILAQKDSIATLNTNRWDALMNWNFMALPYPSYSPETSWQFGLTGVYYFHTSKKSQQFSDLNFDMGYTLNKQWFFNANSKIHFNTTTRWYLDAYLSAKHYPDLFFGISNNIDSIHNPAIKYTANFVDIQAKPNFYISKNWIIGSILRFRYENSILNQQLCKSQNSNINPQLFYNGFEKNIFLGIGAAISYDTRSNNYYPLNGLFFKTTITYNQQLIANNSASANFQIDLRQYIPLYKELILAWNFRSEIALGKNIPFQLLPTIGGQDLIRGIRQNKFKNNTLFAIQTELRIPIWRFLKGAIFASIGDVYNYNNWQWTTPKIGYGIGLRACIHQAKTNIRFDIARQNYNNNWAFYFTVKEAF